MAVARDVKGRIAPRVQKAILAYAFPMEAVGVANSSNAPKVRKAAHISARRTVEVKGAHTWAAQKELKEAHLFARPMVEGNDVHTKVVAQRVYTVAPSFVWLMVEEKDVLYLSALEVQEVRQIVVFVMEVERDARSRIVERVLRVVLISVKHTGAVSGAHGGSPSQILASVALLASVLPEERLACVLHILLS